MPECEVLISVQQIQKTDLLNQLLQVTMLTKTGEYQCSISVEASEEPEP